MNQEIRRIRKYLGSPSAFGLLSVMACDFWISKTVGHRWDLCFLYVITSDECKPRKLWPHLPSGSTVGAISAMVTASNLRSGSGREIFEDLGDDHDRRDALAFTDYGVVDTPRRAGPSVARAGDNGVATFLKILEHRLGNRHLTRLAMLQHCGDLVTAHQ